MPIQGDLPNSGLIWGNLSNLRQLALGLDVSNLGNLRWHRWFGATWRVWDWQWVTWILWGDLISLELVRVDLATLDVCLSSQGCGISAGWPASLSSVLPGNSHSSSTFFFLLFLFFSGMGQSLNKVV